MIHSTCHAGVAYDDVRAEDSALPCIWAQRDIPCGAREFPTIDELIAELALHHPEHHVEPVVRAIADQWDANGMAFGSMHCPVCHAGSIQWTWPHRRMLRARCSSVRCVQIESE